MGTYWDFREQDAELSWEQRWAPHDEPTYSAVLEAIQPADIVLEIGAGDLRLARRLAAIARKVYAIELQLPLLGLAGLQPGEQNPPNLYVIWGDARTTPFPDGITTGVLLMRHCTHFHLYWEKLAAAGATQLLTNARWRMGVERIEFDKERAVFKSVDFGWYACRCGSVGFVPGDPDLLTPDVLTRVHEVSGCPKCMGERSPSRNPAAAARGSSNLKMDP